MTQTLPQHQKRPARSHITDRRLGAAKRGQLRNNKYEDQKVQEQEREDKAQEKNKTMKKKVKEVDKIY